MKHQESSERACLRSPVTSGILRVLGGAVLALVAYEVIKSIPDIKRYWRIRNM